MAPIQGGIDASTRFRAADLDAISEKLLCSTHQTTQAPLPYPNCPSSREPRTKVKIRCSQLEPTKKRKQNIAYPSARQAILPVGAEDPAEREATTPPVATVALQRAPRAIIVAGRTPTPTPTSPPAFPRAGTNLITLGRDIDDRSCVRGNREAVWLGEHDICH